MSKKHNKENTGVKKYATYIWWGFALLLLFGLAYLAVTAPKVAESDLVSSVGLHYHPNLSIVINGEKVSIPNNIGLSATAHNPIHTHEEGDGTLHLEFSGAVKKTDTALGKFFDAWQKEWTETSFMGYPIDATHTLVMKVNGETSVEYRNLQMKDGQKIELIYQ